MLLRRQRQVASAGSIVMQQAAHRQVKSVIVLCSAAAPATPPATKVISATAYAHIPRLAALLRLACGTATRWLRYLVWQVDVTEPAFGFVCLFFRRWRCCCIT